MTGLIIGAIGMVLMLTPWTSSVGITFDTRSVLLSISGLFFGGFPTFIAAAITLAFRVVQGGDGVTMGVVVIISSSVVGVLWKKLRPTWYLKKPGRELLIMGSVVHLIMLACVLLLPESKVYSTFTNISIPLVAIYLPATVLIGRLMVRQHNNFLSRKARETLSESERRYFEILNGSNLLSVLLDEKGNITFCNDYLCHVIGHSKDELYGRNWFDISLPPAARAPVKILFYKIIHGEEHHSTYENEIVCIDGEVLYISWNNSVLRNTEGTIIGTASVGFNITKRKIAERALQIHREKLEEEIQFRTKELVQKNEKLENFNKIFINREFRIKELKEKVRSLERNGE
jgi:PAS domain S-box-containing protein